MSSRKSFTGLPLIPDFFERAVLNWADKRQSVTDTQQIINRHQLYILPTRNGITYFVVLLLVLFGAINYENSLGYMLTFLLGSLGFLGMIYTHSNLNQLKVKIGRPEPVFAGQDIHFPIQIISEHQSTHPALQLQSESGQINTANIINNYDATTSLILSTTKRGYIDAGRIKIFSEFPLGLFHAWSWLKLDSRCLVYPAPAQQHYPLNFTHDTSNGINNSSQQGVDDFTGLREYHAGDLPTYMAWKAIAKTGILQTKLFTSDAAQHISINWSDSDKQYSTEKRLSILCRMILDASDKNFIYGLNLPGLTIKPFNGLHHKQQCLTALALFGTTQ